MVHSARIIHSPGISGLTALISLDKSLTGGGTPQCFTLPCVMFLGNTIYIVLIIFYLRA